MKKIKRILSLVLTLTLLCGAMLLSANAAGPTQQQKAKALFEMGLFNGYDTTGTNFGLNDLVTREQALTLLIRMLGEDSAAKAWTGAVPYADVPADSWALPYIGYAKAKGYTQGMGDNLYGMGRNTSMQEMTVFALRGLGYSDAANVGDFDWNSALSVAQKKGILESTQVASPFLRGNAVDILYGSMAVNVKNQNYDLLSKLMNNGVVSKAQYDKALTVMGGTTTPTTPKTSDIADGTYSMACQGKYFRLSSSSALELRDTTPVQIFTIDNQSNGSTYIKTESGKYIALANVKDGEQLTARSTPFAWLIKKESGDVYSIRPYDKQSFVVNASGESSANGTKMIIWSHSNTPNHAKITIKAAGTRVTSVKLDQTSVSLGVGKTKQLTGTISPTTAANQDVTWSSSNTAVAKVDQNGLVTAVKAGTATITVKTSDGSKTATCAVTVTSGTVAVTGVKLDQTAVTLGVGKTKQITGTISPTTATNQAVTWSSNNSAVAKVDSDGLVTAVKVGTATITVKTSDGSKTATCTVTVTNDTVAVTGVKLDQTSVSVAVGKTSQLTGTISPTTATNQEVLWSSNNTSIAKVDQNGLVTGVKAGTATITVKTSDGAKTATCTVTVTAASSSNSPITATFRVTNKTGKTITECYIQDSNAVSYGKEFLESNDYGEWKDNEYIDASFEFYPTTKFDIYLRCSDGTEFEAKELSFAKATSAGGSLDLSTTQAKLTAGGDVASADFTKKNTSTTTPSSKKIIVKFVNTTDTDFTNFTAKPVGGAATNPSLVKKNNGEIAFEFTPTSAASKFEIQFTANQEKYVLENVTFASDIPNGSTVQINFVPNNDGTSIEWEQVK